MEDVGGERGESWLACFERGFLARAEDEELARHRRRFATGERDVQRDDPLRVQAFGETARIARRDGRAERDDEARARRLDDAVGSEDHRLDLVVEAYDDDDEIAAPRHFARRIGERNAERERVAARRLERIEAGYAAPFREQTH